MHCTHAHTHQHPLIQIKNCLLPVAPPAVCCIHAQEGSSTRFLPALRLLRVARVFRLVKSAKGMRKLLSTLYW